MTLRQQQNTTNSVQLAHNIYTHTYTKGGKHRLNKNTWIWSTWCKTYEIRLIKSAQTMHAIPKECHWLLQSVTYVHSRIKDVALLDDKMLLINYVVPNYRL